MSYFGRNIKKIRNAKKISQSAFAILFQLKRGSIGAYEEGRAEAKIDTVIEIANYFKLTLDQLLKKELTINDIYHLNDLSQKLDTIKRTNKEGHAIPIVQEKDKRAYIAGFDNFTFLSGLKTIRIPDLFENSIAFEYSGPTLLSAFSGITSGDLFISKPLEVSNIPQVSENQIHVVLTESELLIGRLVFSEFSIHMKFDNPKFSHILIEKSKIKKLWQVYKVISENVPIMDSLEMRIDNLENKISNLIEMKRK